MALQDLRPTPALLRLLSAHGADPRVCTRVLQALKAVSKLPANRAALGKATVITGVLGVVERSQSDRCVAPPHLPARPLPIAHKSGRPLMILGMLQACGEGGVITGPEPGVPGRPAAGAPGGAEGGGRDRRGLEGPP
jgi:hypothetical protein